MKKYVPWTRKFRPQEDRETLRSLEECAQIMGITKMRALQLERSALAKIALDHEIRVLAQELGFACRE